MKLRIAALAISLALAGCQQSDDAKDSNKAPAKAEKSDAPQKGATDNVQLADKDKMAYGLGAGMAAQIGELNSTYKALDMDMEVFKQGFLDQLGGQSRLSLDEVMQQTQIFRQKLSFAQQQKMNEERDALMAENKKYLEENLNNGFTQTESGLQYKVLKAAPEGAETPNATDQVRVHYTGTFTDGKEFDSSKNKGQPFEFSLAGGVIQGWLEGVKLMPVGSTFKFVIPPELGYGYRGGPKPGAILEFEVELLEIVKPEEHAEEESK